MSQPLTFGIISFAHGHAHGYTKCLQQIAEATLVGIYDDDNERGQAAAHQHSVPYFSSLDELLAIGLDGVMICSENANHRAHVEAAAGQTGAILCEKPIATTLEDGQAMIDKCAATSTKLQIAFPVRFAPTIQRLKALLDDEKLGQVYGAKCTNHGSMPGNWFVQEELSGGGAVIDHTVHVIDLLRWFWGSEVTQVYAEIGESLLHPELGIDDAGLLSFQLANGIYGTLDTSWSRSPSYLTWGDVKIEVVGEKGAIQVDAFDQHLTVASEQAGKSRWQNWGSNMDLGLVQDFVEMIRQDRAPSITGYDGQKALEVALAAYESARQGQSIQLG
ncbi:MAG: Gfo/Idh/MocA family oxidoreductase [Chloroflexota bacterium]